MARGQFPLAERILEVQKATRKDLDGGNFNFPLTYQSWEQVKIDIGMEPVPEEEAKKGRKPITEASMSTIKFYNSRFRGASLETVEEYLAESGTSEVHSFDELKENLFVAISIPREIVDFLNNKTNKNRADNSRNIKSIPDHKALVMAFGDWLVSTNPETKAIGLMAVTGRRWSEIMLTAEFASVEEVVVGEHYQGKVREKYYVMFRGQLKTKDGEDTMQDWYKIPVLAEAHIVLAAWKALRSSNLSKSFSEVYYSNQRKAENYRMNNRFRALLDDLPETVISKSLRKRMTMKYLRNIYAAICWHEFANQETITQPAYYSDILGHKYGDLTTPQSYMTHFVSTGSAKTDAATKRKMTREIKRLQAEAEAQDLARLRGELIEEN